MACIADLVDGDLARRRNLVTEVGKIADPIADKALIGAALLGLSGLGDLPWWVTAVVLARAGMGLSILSEMAIQADHRVLTAKDGFAPIDRTEVALVAAPDASPATLRLADRLAEFCNTVQAKAA